MDILNWLYLAKNKFVRNTPSSDKDFMIFGAKVGTTKRGDLYQNYAMSVEDFTTNVSNVVKPYKVYTALLTQSGSDNPIPISSGPVAVGVTYYIDGAGPNSDFTNVGGPAIGTNSQYFVATSSAVPNNYDGASLIFNAGAPVVTVLENTIGNIWFTYDGVGSYFINSNELFTNGKTYLYNQAFLYGPDEDRRIGMSSNDSTSIQIVTTNGITLGNNNLYNTSIEIRVYN